MQKAKSTISLEAIRDHLLTLENNDGRKLFQKGEILPYSFRESEDIFYFTASAPNLFPAFFIIPGPEKRDNGGFTRELEITIFMLEQSYPREAEALVAFSHLQEAANGFEPDDFGCLPTFGPAKIHLSSLSPENFPGNLTGIMVNLEAYYGK